MPITAARICQRMLQIERQAADRLSSVGDPAAGLSTDHVSCPDQIKHQMSSIALSVKRCLQRYLQKTVVTFSQYICHIAELSSILNANVVCGYTASMDNNLETTTPSSKVEQVSNPSELTPSELQFSCQSTRPW